MMNPMQLFQMIKNSGNPQQLAQQLIQQNPQLQQVLNGVNVNDTNQMEQLCKNICVQKGLDFDTMIAQFKQNGGKLN